MINNNYIKYLDEFETKIIYIQYPNNIIRELLHDCFVIKNDENDIINNIIDWVFDVRGFSWHVNREYGHNIQNVVKLIQQFLEPLLTKIINNELKRRPHIEELVNEYNLLCAHYDKIIATNVLIKYYPETKFNKINKIIMLLASTTLIKPNDEYIDLINIYLIPLIKYLNQFGIENQPKLDELNNILEILKKRYDIDTIIDKLINRNADADSDYIDICYYLNDIIKFEKECKESRIPPHKFIFYVNELLIPILTEEF